MGVWGLSPTPPPSPQFSSFSSLPILIPPLPVVDDSVVDGISIITGTLKMDIHQNLCHMIVVITLEAIWMHDRACIAWE